MNETFVFGLQLVCFRWDALGEDLSDEDECEVVDAEVDDARAGHVLSPHGNAELISGLVTGADDAVVCLDGSGGSADDGGVLADHVAEPVTEVRQAADPDVLGQ